MIYGNLAYSIVEEQELESLFVSKENFNKNYNYLNNYNQINEGALENFESFLENFLKDFINPDSITNTIDDIKKCASNIAQNFKSKGINKKSLDASIKEYENCISSIAKNIHLSDSLSLKFGNYDANKIKIASILLIVNVLINSIAMMIFNILFIWAPQVPYVLTVVFVCPIAEEFFKKLSVRYGCEKEFFVLFNTYEFTNYIISYASLMGLKKMVKVRTLAVGMHLANTIIHYLTNNEKIQKLLNISEEDKDKLPFIGQVVATVIHILWNGNGNFVMKIFDGFING